MGVTTYTVIATGQTTASAEEVEAAVRASLTSVGLELVPCNWAPDLDTIAEQTGVPFGTNQLIDLN